MNVSPSNMFLTVVFVCKISSEKVRLLLAAVTINGLRVALSFYCDQTVAGDR